MLGNSNPRASTGLYPACPRKVARNAYKEGLGKIKHAVPGKRCRCVGDVRYRIHGDPLDSYPI